MESVATLPPRPGELGGFAMFCQHNIRALLESSFPKATCVNFDKILSLREYKKSILSKLDGLDALIYDRETDEFEFKNVKYDEPNHELIDELTTQFELTRMALDDLKVDAALLDQYMRVRGHPSLAMQMNLDVWQRLSEQEKKQWKEKSAIQHETDLVEWEKQQGVREREGEGVSSDEDVTASSSGGSKVGQAERAGGEPTTTTTTTIGTSSSSKAVPPSNLEALASSSGGSSGKRHPDEGVALGSSSSANLEGQPAVDVQASQPGTEEVGEGGGAPVSKRPRSLG